MKEFKKKLPFTVKNVDGKEINLCVKRPTMEQSKTLQKTYNTAFMEALENKAPLYDKLDAVARAQGVWSDELEAKVNQLDAKVKDLEVKLGKGGNAGLTKKKAFELAKELRRLRIERRGLVASRDRLGQNTAEAQAKDAQFNQQIALCTFYNDGPNEGKPYFADLEDFLERVSEEAAIEAAKQMSCLSFNLDPNYENSLPENKFLIKYGYADGQGRLVNKDGKLVDEDGRLINEEGRFVDKDGQYVDRDGNRVDEDGNLVVEFAEFLDEEAESV